MTVTTYLTLLNYFSKNYFIFLPGICAPIISKHYGGAGGEGGAGGDDEDDEEAHDEL